MKPKTVQDVKVTASLLREHVERSWNDVSEHLTCRANARLDRCKGMGVENILQDARAAAGRVLEARTAVGHALMAVHVLEVAEQRPSPKKALDNPMAWWGHQLANMDIVASGKPRGDDAEERVRWEKAWGPVDLASRLLRQQNPSFERIEPIVRFAMKEHWGAFDDVVYVGAVHKGPSFDVEAAVNVACELIVGEGVLAMIATGEWGGLHQSFPREQEVMGRRQEEARRTVEGALR